MAKAFCWPTFSTLIWAFDYWTDLPQQTARVNRGCTFDPSQSFLCRSITPLCFPARFHLQKRRPSPAAMSWFSNLIRISAASSSIRHSHPHRPFILSAVSYFSSSSTPPVRVADELSPSGLAGLGPTKPDEKPRIVVIGTGWAGCRLMKGIDTSIYDVICVSPRNHMVFTPLLASTCVGTLEFRSVAEPVARIQPAISREPGSYFFLAACKGVDADNHEIQCETVTDGDGVNPVEPWKFKVSYDKLIIAAGAEALTFGIHGVKEHAIFLREVHHAQEIRRKLLLNLMLSDVPGISVEEKSRLLHCVVVGGGPTGVEFSGELSDFIIRDVHERYSHVKDYVHVTLIEANEILSSFDVRLRQYATRQLTKSGVRLVRGVVKDVQPDKIILNDGTEVPYGLLVWSTGVGPSPFIKSLQFPKSPGGRIGVDEWLRVPTAQDVFSIGDCSGYLESTGKHVLPALAQVAERQGKYLARLLNQIGKAGGGRANMAADMELGAPFVYKHLGSMATVGSYKALVDLRQSKEAKGLALAGFVSWLVWRSAYLTRVSDLQGYLVKEKSEADI
ncbi:Internal alternative NAD(P)H-ubiquinone oxidoreductase A1, mitochondrial [Asimina triloba]